MRSTYGTSDKLTYYSSERSESRIVDNFILSTRSGPSSRQARRIKFINLSVVSYITSVLLGLVLGICVPFNASKADTQYSITPYVLYKVGLFDKILPTDGFYSGEELSELRISASPGEYEPTTFVIKANQDLQDVMITSTPFEPGGVEMDIRIVKVWWQANSQVFIPADYTPDKSILVPELLVYDDMEPLAVTFSNGIATPPTISTELKTQIPNRTVKQFWITVHIPKSLEPGEYSSTLSIGAANADSLQIPLSVTVLPIELLEPKQYYVIMYTPRPNIQYSTHGDIVEIELEDIRNHGFKGIKTGSAEAENISNLTRMAKKVGFEGPMVIPYELGQADVLATNLQTLDSYGYGRDNRYIYGQDEPYKENSDSPAKSINFHIRKSYDIHKAGEKVVTSVFKDIADRLENPLDNIYDVVDPVTKKSFRQMGMFHEKLDWANYQPDTIFGTGASEREYMNSLINGKGVKSNKIETYYWMMWAERPKYNRLISGYFLWHSKMDGVMPYCYQDSFSGNVFDERNAPANNYRPLLSTYPSSEGPIPTLQWEAVREGYDDMRYLTTYAKLLEKYKEVDFKKASQIEAHVLSNLSKYKDILRYREATFENEVATGGEDFEDTRALIIDKILTMQEEMDVDYGESQEGETETKGNGGGCSLNKTNINIADTVLLLFILLAPVLVARTIRRFRKNHR